jgi:hypothetical protein
MIEIPRVLARRLRAVLRKAVPRDSPRGGRPPLTFHAGPGGLRVRSLHPEVCAEYHEPMPRPAAVVTLPGSALDDFEGRAEALVKLTPAGQGSVQANWDDQGVPRLCDYTAPDPDKLGPFPESPVKFTDPGPGFLQALAEAARVAAPEHVRFTLQKVQLRGRKGEVVATDGKQLLIQGGFSLPWADDVLVPAATVFGCPELARDAPVGVGRTEAHVGVRVGPWTFLLTTDPKARFPPVGEVIPSEFKGVTVCRLEAQDAAFLARALPRLPGAGDDLAPITLDLGDSVVVRARAEGQTRVTEVVLRRSEVTGRPVRLATNRLYLSRALGLGFAELRVVSPEAPVVSRDGRRTYLWMPLPKHAVLPPADDALRVTPDGQGPAVAPINQPQPERSEVVMAKSPNNGTDNGSGTSRALVPVPQGHTGQPPRPNGAPGDDLLAEAESLRSGLQILLAHANRLVAALKHQRRQTRALQAAVASLRQLDPGR